MKIRIGLGLGTQTLAGDAERFPGFVDALEARGFDSLWLSERLTGPAPDPLVALAMAAGRTRKLKLGTSVLVVPGRNPVVLAKELATLDRLSGGRLRLGLGIGWQREEYAAVGARFERRGLRLEEGIAAMRALWRDRPASYAGETVAFDRVHSLPQPTRGGVPVVLGGNSAAAVDRAGRLADGWFPYTIRPDDLAASAERLVAAAASAGRGADEVPITVWPGSADPSRELDAEWVGRFVAAGATRLVVRPRVATAADLAAVPAFVARYREDVLSRV